MNWDQPLAQSTEEDDQKLDCSGATLLQLVSLPKLCRVGIFVLVWPAYSWDLKTSDSLLVAHASVALGGRRFADNGEVQRCKHLFLMASGSFRIAGRSALTRWCTCSCQNKFNCEERSKCREFLHNLRATSLEPCDICKIWGFYGGDYEELCFLGSYAVWLL
jgi:hypothetical protein